jgi:hypothetical protein
MIMLLLATTIIIALNILEIRIISKKETIILLLLNIIIAIQ